LRISHPPSPSAAKAATERRRRVGFIGRKEDKSGGRQRPRATATPLRRHLDPGPADPQSCPPQHCSDENVAGAGRSSLIPKANRFFPRAGKVANPAGVLLKQP
jgi:hypothetical protein